MQSMRQLEFHWNRKYQYPWVFFNDEPFSEEFKVSARASEGERVFCHVIDAAERWQGGYTEHHVVPLLL